MAKKKIDLTAFNEHAARDKVGKKLNLDVYDDVPSEAESFVRGAAQGGSLGFADEIAGAIDSLSNTVQGKVRSLDEAVEAYKKGRDESRAAYSEAQVANPYAFGAGNVTGSVATAFVPGLNVAKGATLGKTMLQGAALGGANAAGLSAADLTKGEVGEFAKDLGQGAVLGGSVPVAFNLGGRVAKTIASKAHITKEGAKRALAKGAKLFSGVDEEAALRQIERPAEMAAAQGDDFVNDLARIADSEMDAKGSELGKAVRTARNEFMDTLGSEDFSAQRDLGSQRLVNMIEEFVEDYKPSKLGFSGVKADDLDTLKGLAVTLEDKTVSGEDLIKLKDYLDHVKKLATKFDKEETGPFINFLKQLRHTTDAIIDEASPKMNSTNRAYEKFKSDQALLKPLQNEGQAESFIGNLYGANKKARQEAAERILTPETMDRARDVAANKAFANAKGPAGSEFGARRIMGATLAIPTLGSSAALTSPQAWQKGLSVIGKAMNSNPSRLGKYASVLSNAAKRGNHNLAVTNYLLSQQDIDYRMLVKRLEGEDKD